MKKKILFIIGILIILVVLVILFSNKLNHNYNNLSNEDKQILAEYNTFYEKSKNDDVWKNFNLRSHAIVIISKDSGNAYIINSKNAKNGIFNQKINMPKNFSLESVYRLSPLMPKVLILRFSPGNFNTIGEKYSMFDQDIYYVKYDKKTSLEKKYSSEHFITYLSHEAFHYYMQNKWKGGNSPEINLLNSTDLELLKKEENILGEIQNELSKDKYNHNTLLEYSKEYVDIVDKRLKENEKYVSEELAKETIEGTATYVGIKASRMVGYDFGVMYFDNKKNVSFSDIFPAFESGKIKKSFFSTRLPYENGAEICLLLNALGVKDWQEQLNKQSNSKPETLYSILKNYLNS